MFETHLSDQTLLSAADGELSPCEAAQVAEHLADCWACRVRKQEIEAAVGDFIRVYRRSLGAGIPLAGGPRALLGAQMHEISTRQSAAWFFRLWLFRVYADISRLSPAVAAFAGVLTVAVCLSSLASVLWLRSETKHAVTLLLPDHTLTPGATIQVGRDEICRADGTGNKAVPVALQREVFREYRIQSAPREYEVDYLITPGLGGADDIHNLWPESYRATTWNAHVKDQLEDYLRDRVCAGTLDLATAQEDLAVNWIDAYKRYFHTDRPLDEVPPKRP
jgi:hypothetical protein